MISFRELQDQGNFVETVGSRNVTEKSLMQLKYVTVCGGVDAPLLKSIEVFHLHRVVLESKGCFNDVSLMGFYSVLGGCKNTLGVWARTFGGKIKFHFLHCMIRVTKFQYSLIMLWMK